MNQSHLLQFILVTIISYSVGAFTTPRPVFKSQSPINPIHPAKTIVSQLYAINDKRRKQLGIADDEDEYDLDFALDQNTDPLITKIIAGSAILAIISLLVVGLIVPMTTDYGEGVCSPIQSGGRC